MQQAYRVLRIVSEAQTIRIVLVLAPDELMLRELCTACAALNTESSSGIKAVGTSVVPEQVIKRVVLHNNDDQVLNRRARDLSGRSRSRSRIGRVDSIRIPRTAAATA